VSKYATDFACGRDSRHALITESAAPLCLEETQLVGYGIELNKLTKGRDQKAVRCDGTTGG
jgi:hypothetical protein